MQMSAIPKWGRQVTFLLQTVFLLLYVSSLLYALLRGNGAQTAGAMIAAAGEGVQAAIGLAGGFAFFCGLIAVLERAGAARALVRVFRPLLGRLGIPDAALPDAALNISANLLGMSNAAAPMGLRAAKRMADNGIAGNGLCLFLVINASSVQLLPTSVISLRAAAGSVSPGCITAPTLLATLISTSVGILSCKALERWT